MAAVSTLTRRLLRTKRVAILLARGLKYRCLLSFARSDAFLLATLGMTSFSGPSGFPAYGCEPAIPMGTFQYAG
jgi:hypothetical protein